MAITYEPIATTTLGSAQADITFSTIPATYTDLVIVYTLKAATGSSDIYLRFNGSSASDYSNTILTGNGTAASSTRFSNATQIRLNNATDILTTDGTMLICNVNNYSNSTTFKTALYRIGLASDATEAGVGLWRSTSAITSVALTLASGNLGTGCTATIYGIKAE
jgi:hypothetical protein